MSPPVTDIPEDMERRRKVPITPEPVRKEVIEDEESEWEWTEEDESDEEEGTTYEIRKEGWENIMSDSKGPTTFKAEYSIKIGS